MNSSSGTHIPVLLQETIAGLRLSANRNVIDGTLGGGGHARVILEHTAPHGHLIGFDRDEPTLNRSAAQLQHEFGDRFIPIHDSYAALDTYAEMIAEIGPIHGIFVDLGFSSFQIDDPERGFSFQYQGPLDMRFDQTQGETAADILNNASAEELKRIFRTYGEEPQAGRVAAAVVRTRQIQPFQKTVDLVECVERTIYRKRHQRIHPATRIFQALRIAVNHELEHLEAFLPRALDILAPGGRLAVISFHSLEDRIVKHYFRFVSSNCICPPELPECRCTHRATATVITKKPIQPTEEEVQINSRARSAKLRILEKKL